MRNIFYSSLLTLMMLMSSACLKQSETITPIAPVRTLAELQREAMMQQALKAAGNTELSAAARATIEAGQADPTLFYLNLRYSIKDFDLNSRVDLENGYEILSHSLLRSLARLFLSLTGPRDINLDPFEVDMPDLNLDKEIVKSIKVKRVYFEFNKAFDTANGNKLSFAFIERFSLAKMAPLKETFVYKKLQNHCKFKCIEFTISDSDFTQQLTPDQPLVFKPSVTINTIPKTLQMHLDGQIDIQVGLKLPF